MNKSVVLDDVLSQLRVWQSQKDENPVIIMLRILFSVETVPLKSSEMRAIISDVEKCLTSLNDVSLKDYNSADLKLVKSLLECRSSFSFMPAISRYMDSINLHPINNDLSPVIAAELHILMSPQKRLSNICGRTFTTQQTKDIKGELFQTSISPVSVQLSNSDFAIQRPPQELAIPVSKREETSPKNEKNPILPPKEYPNSKKYFVCNIIRHQSTLWTSYRLYLDHVMDLNSSGELLRDSANTMYFNSNSSNLNDSYSSNENDESQQHSKPIEQPQSNSRGLFLLGAKKLTTVSMSSQWHIWDSNVSATADSKFWKEKNATGRVSVARSTVLSSGGMSPSRQYTPRIYTGNLLSMSASAVMPLLYQKQIQGNLSQQQQQQQQQQSDGLEDRSPEQADLTGDGEDCQPSASMSGTSKKRNSNNYSEAAAISVSSNGSDKLIHVVVVASRMTLSPADVNTHESDDSSSNKLSGDEPQLRYEGGALSELENVLRTNNQSLIDFNKYLLLRSKQPRKISTQNGKKEVHAVEFGKFNRVKEASRKNLVIDSVFESGGTFATEWGLSNADKPPVLQIGKVDEDCFSLDFYDLTPFQAFAIALAAFDQ